MNKVDEIRQFAEDLRTLLWYVDNYLDAETNREWWRAWDDYKDLRQQMLSILDRH